MNKLTKLQELEREILKATTRAQSLYSEMAGWWLSHAPESFLQHEIARSIYDLDYYVFVDASGHKVKRDMKPKKGPIPKVLNKRHDLTVFYKNGETLLAIIEIKRAWAITELKKDVEKLRKSLEPKYAAKNGYLLVYSEVKKSQGLEMLEKRFEGWASKLGISIVRQVTRSPARENWCWGAALFKV